MEAKIYSNQQLFSYAYLSVSFDKQKDIFKNYVALIEYFIGERRFTEKKIKFEILHDGINELFGLKIPKATLQKLLQIMQKDGKAKISGDGIVFDTKKFNAQYLNFKNEIEDEFQILFLDFKAFLNNKGKNINNDEVKSIFCNFLINNSFVVAELYSNHEPNIYDLEEYSEDIIEYLNELRTRSTKIYNTVLKLTIGAIRTSILSLTPEKIADLNSDKVLLEKVIIDTNYLLRLLNLQSALDCQIAKETFNMLKKLNVEFIVMTKTIDETLISISNYLFQTDTVTPATRKILKNNKIYPSGFLAAEENGLNRSKILEYRDRQFISQKIMDLGITIVEENVQINQSDIDLLIKEKNRTTYSIENAEHDLTLIEYCNLLRKNKKKPISAEKVWVLTNDAKLTNWHKRKCSNYGYACITESQIASYIWLQSGNTGIELNYAILALASQNSVNIEQVLEFQKAYTTFAKDKSEYDIKQLALVFACGDITKDDLLDVNDNETMENFISRQITDIESKQKQNEKAIQEQTDLLNDQIKAKDNSIQIELQNLIEESNKIKEEIQKKEIENNSLTHKRDGFIKVKTLLKKTGIVIALLIFAITVLCFILSIFLFKKYNIGENAEFFQYLYSLMISLVLPAVFLIVSIFFTGKPTNPSQFFEFLKLKFCQKRINLILAGIEYNSEDLDEKNLLEAISKLNKSIEENNSKLQEFRIEHGKIEYAIKRIYNLE